MAKDQAKISRAFRARLKANGQRQVMVALPETVVDMYDRAAVARGVTREAFLREFLSEGAPRIVETTA